MIAKAYLDPICLFTVDMGNISIISANFTYLTTSGYVMR